ncbi:MFS transporter [Rubrobacter indicoceani]|uniref:MFS transporter n=1 Tax=Rubrobacter indicoceani TaxID=2051957 RepID=UPI001F08E946|nr:MFS transporter [Rubrobacter indicoceani]
MLAFALAAYYSRTVSESEIFEKSEVSDAPLRRLFSGENLKNIFQVFVIMSGFWLSLQAIAAVLPGVLGREESGLSYTEVTLALVISYVVVAGVYLPAGMLSQRVGRRPFLIASGLAMASLATFFYYLLIRLAPENFLVVLLLTTLIVVIGILPWALTPAYVNERFRTDVRASGYGISYSIAVILPSFYAYYQAGLSAFIPFEYTTLVLLVAGALLISAGAALGPETKNVEMGDK